MEIRLFIPMICTIRDVPAWAVEIQRGNPSEISAIYAMLCALEKLSLAVEQPRQYLGNLHK